jgi:hypothetical protein
LKEAAPEKGAASVLSLPAAASRLNEIDEVIRARREQQRRVVIAFALAIEKNPLHLYCALPGPHHPTVAVQARFDRSANAAARLRRCPTVDLVAVLG